MVETSDVLIAGGGPAGLSCALILARCRRSVTVLDSGSYRNAPSLAMHGYLSRDGVSPMDFLEQSRQDLRKYGVRLISAEARTAKKMPHGFSVWDEQGNEYRSKKLVLATGVRDVLPPFKNIERFYGKSVFHCPYCDGYEFREKAWAVYAARKKAALDLCLKLRTWTSRITLLAANLDLSRSERAKLHKYGIAIRTEEIAGLAGKGTALQYVKFTNGEKLRTDALFFSMGQKPASDLAKQLGARCSPKGLVHFDHSQQTNVKGLHVAGDVARDMQFVIVAAAEGVKAGVAINTELNRENRSL